jgi:large subunit ribosomal protein L10
MVAPYKIREVDKLKEIISSGRVIGLVGIGGIPAPQLQSMRELLRKKTLLRASKNSLISLAFERSEIDKMKEMINFIRGETAILATDMNPFKLFKEIDKMKMKVPAKGGEISLQDIIVDKGETPFKPGPIVGDLQKAGIPAAIQGGKVIIREKTMVVKKGDKIPANTAQMLTRLGIKPLEIGLDLLAVNDNGIIFTPDILSISKDEVIGDIARASSNAIAVAMHIGYYTDSTIRQFIKKAHLECLSLATKADWLVPWIVKEKIATAHRRALSIKGKINWNK